MKKKRNPSKHVFILANKTTSSTLFYLFFVFNEKNRAHIDIYYNFYSTFATDFDLTGAKPAMLNK